MLSKFDLLCTGKLEDVSLVTSERDISFSIPSHSFRSRPRPGRSDIRFLLEQYGHPIVEYMSKRAHISKLILWENVWGYVIWMYSMFLQEEYHMPHQDDLRFCWMMKHGSLNMRRSPFKQFLQNEPTLQPWQITNGRLVACIRNCQYRKMSILPAE